MCIYTVWARLLGALAIWMARGERLKVHNRDEVVFDGCMAFFRKTNKHRKEADLKLLIGDEVVATDYRIHLLGVHALFSFHTNNPFIS